jgi:hypothetical protein
MKRTLVAISLCTSVILAGLFSGCRSSCPGDTSGIAEGDQFRITVLSMSSSTASCAAPSLPSGTSYVVVAGPAEPLGGASCAPIVHAAESVIPSPAFDPGQLTSCTGRTLGGGVLGFTCSGTEPSGCAIDADVVFDKWGSDGGADASDLGSMSVSWGLSACGQAQCDQSYGVRIDRLGSDAGLASDALADGA